MLLHASTDTKSKWTQRQQQPVDKFVTQLSSRQKSESGFWAAAETLYFSFIKHRSCWEENESLQFESRIKAHSEFTKILANI